MALAAELSLDVPFADLRHEAVLNVVHTANLIASTGAILFRRWGLTEAQFNVLFALKHKRVDVTQSDLGKRLVVTRASITSVLDKLEQKGLVERRNVPGNRRIYHVSLTDAGRRLVDEVEVPYREEIHQALTDLNKAEIHSLIRSLERIRARVAAIRSEV